MLTTRFSSCGCFVLPRQFSSSFSFLFFSLSIFFVVESVAQDKQLECPCCLVCLFFPRLFLRQRNRKAFAIFSRDQKFQPITIIVELVNVEEGRQRCLQRALHGMSGIQKIHLASRVSEEVLKKKSPLCFLSTFAKEKKKFSFDTYACGTILTNRTRRRSDVAVGFIRAR